MANEANHDPEKMYQISKLIPNAWREHHPELALLERKAAEREIAQYPGVLFVSEEEGPFDSLLVRFEKVPLWLARKRWEKDLAKRGA